MLFYSTAQHSVHVDFATATVLGQPADRGLFFPEEIPVAIPGMPGVDPHWATINPPDLWQAALAPYVGSSLTLPALRELATHAMDFPVPLKRINDRIFSLELFHGPTLAFKDVGARFMSQCLAAFRSDAEKLVTVLVATSGDTGGAVAAGFWQVPGVEVIILYPSGKVSAVQEQQLTTLGGNVLALEVAGTFDDCQAIVKQAFADEALGYRYQLTSANSINVARWLPQQLYYLQAARVWEQLFPGEAPVIAVPSGNFGNISAGVLAWASGMRVQHFIAACNANRTVPDFLASGTYEIRPAVATISNAMDVGNPSNFGRLQAILEARNGGNMLSAVSISDAATESTIEQVWKTYGYLLDPHGAVAYRALEDYLDQHPGARGYILETAHPIKFADVVEPIIGRKIPKPLSLAALEGKEKSAVKMAADYVDFKAFMLAR
jgi:threonine synthase